MRFKLIAIFSGTEPQKGSLSQVYLKRYPSPALFHLGHLHISKTVQFLDDRAITLFNTWPTVTGVLKRVANSQKKRVFEFILTKWITASWTTVEILGVLCSSTKKSLSYNCSTDFFARKRHNHGAIQHRLYMSSRVFFFGINTSIHSTIPDSSRSAELKPLIRSSGSSVS